MNGLIAGRKEALIMSKGKSNITCMSPPVGSAAYYVQDDGCGLIKCPVASLVYALVDGVPKKYVYVFNAHVVDPRNTTMMEVNEVVGGSLVSVGPPDELQHEER